MTFGSGIAYSRNQFVATSVPGVNANITLPVGRTPWQKEVDFRFRKNFLAYRGNDIGVTASVFNVFNTQNFGCYNGFLGVRQ